MSRSPATCRSIVSVEAISSSWWITISPPTAPKGIRSRSSTPWVIRSPSPQSLLRPLKPCVRTKSSARGRSRPPKDTGLGTSLPCLALLPCGTPLFRYLPLAARHPPDFLRHSGHFAPHSLLVAHYSSLSISSQPGHMLYAISSYLQGPPPG